MKKPPDEAAHLETQANRLEAFVAFSRPAPAVFRNLEPSASGVPPRPPSRPASAVNPTALPAAPKARARRPTETDRTD